jgi:hypothetical protein
MLLQSNNVELELPVKQLNAEEEQLQLVNKDVLLELHLNQSIHVIAQLLQFNNVELLELLFKLNVEQELLLNVNKDATQL